MSNGFGNIAERLSNMLQGLGNMPGGPCGSAPEFRSCFHCSSFPI